MRKKAGKSSLKTNRRVLRTSPVASSRLPSVSTRYWLSLAARLIWAAYVRGPTDLKYVWNRISCSALSPLPTPSACGLVGAAPARRGAPGARKFLGLRFDVNGWGMTPLLPGGKDGHTAEVVTGRYDPGTSVHGVLHQCTADRRANAR